MEPSVAQRAQLRILNPITHSAALPMTMWKAPSDAEELTSAHDAPFWDLEVQARPSFEISNMCSTDHLHPPGVGPHSFTQSSTIYTIIWYIEVII